MLLGRDLRLERRVAIKVSEVEEGPAGAAERFLPEISAAGLVVRSASRSQDAVAGGGDVDAIGRRLGVAYVVDGGVQRGPSRVRTTLRLVRVRDAIVVWAGSFDAATGDPLDGPGRMALEAATQIRLRILPAAGGRRDTATP